MCLTKRETKEASSLHDQVSALTEIVNKLVHVQVSSLTQTVNDLATEFSTFKTNNSPSAVLEPASSVSTTREIKNFEITNEKKKVVKGAWDKAENVAKIKSALCIKKKGLDIDLE